MDKQTWLDLPQKDRAAHIKHLLRQIIEIDTLETAKCKLGPVKPHDDKYKLEQNVLEIIAWEKEENED